MNRHDGEDFQDDIVDANSEANEAACNWYQVEKSSQYTKRNSKQKESITLLEECPLPAKCFRDSVENAHPDKEENGNDNNLEERDATQQGRVLCRIMPVVVVVLSLVVRSRRQEMTEWHR